MQDGGIAAVSYTHLDKVENGYAPVMNDAHNPNADQMKKNIEALQMLLAQISFEKEKNTIDIGTIEKLFYLFMSEPSIVEVKAYGDNLFSDDVIDGNYKKTAAELTWEQIRNQRFLRRMMIVSGAVSYTHLKKKSSSKAKKKTESNTTKQVEFPLTRKKQNAKAKLMARDLIL